MNPEIVDLANQVANAPEMPPEIAQTMLSATVIAGLIRLLIGLTKTPLFGNVWAKLPPLAKPGLLLALTAVGFFVDNLVVGQPWFLAMGSALTALGGAVLSHEWQNLLIPRVPVPAAPAPAAPVQASAEPAPAPSEEPPAA